jgi:hypothetical protein
MSNQSSVEWLYQEFERIDKEFHVGSHEYNYAKNLAFKISKAMHKEEMIDFAMKFMMQDRPIISFYNSTFVGEDEPQKIE